MGTESIFTNTDRPDVEIMNINVIIITTKSSNISNELVSVDLTWASFHQNANTVFNNWCYSKANNHRENESTNGISNNPCWLKEDDSTCSAYTNRHNHVTKSVQESGIDVNISSFWSLLGSIFTMIVIVVAFMFFTTILALLFFVAVVVIMSASTTSHVVASFALMKNFHLDQVEEETHNSGNGHLWSFNLLWFNYTASSFENKPNCQGKQKYDRDHSSNNLSSVPSKSELF